MIERKKKIILAQIFLFFLGLIIFLFTYLGNKQSDERKILSKQTEKKFKENLTDKVSDKDLNVFFNIEYSGFDLSGNRYILKSKEARTNKDNEELIFMTDVEASFYFKDDTTLYIWSKQGEYNNKTLDMKFDQNLKAIYENSKLTAEKAEFSNSKGFLKITNNVKIDDIQGNLGADELLFDLKDKTLKISSFDNNRINAKIKLNEKRF